MVCVPVISILMIAEDLRRSFKPPELVETEGLKRVKSDRNVYVDPTDRKFRKSTGDLAPGECGSCVMKSPIVSGTFLPVLAREQRGNNKLRQSQMIRCLDIG